MNSKGWAKFIFLFFLIIIFISCGENSENDKMYMVGGRISGVTGPVVLQNSANNDTINISGNGIFSFGKLLREGESYNISAISCPTDEYVAISYGSGTVGSSAVTNISVTVSKSGSTYLIGGTISGLTGSVVLVNNGETITVAADGNFYFPTKLSSGQSYNVTVQTQPLGKYITIKNGSGIVGAADVGNIVATVTEGDFYGLYLFNSSYSDSGGNNNHLTLASGTATYTNDRFGATKRAVLSTGSYQTAARTQPLAYTVSVWVKFISTPDSRGLIYAGQLAGADSSPSLNVLISGSATFNHYMYWDGGGSNVTGGTPIVQDVWYHVVMVGTSNPVESSLYVNGVLDATTFSSAGGYQTSEDCWKIPEYAMPHLLDDVRIYHRKLTAAQIAAIYNAEKP